MSNSLDDEAVRGPQPLMVAGDEVAGQALSSPHDTAHSCGDDVQRALSLISRIAAEYQLGEIARRCETTRTQGREGALQVAVLGRFKAGKTTLLNALLDEPLLPVKAIPATAVITRLRYGPTTEAVIRLSDGQTRIVDPQHLTDWVTQSGNPNNTRGVEDVEVTSPALLDLPSLVLVDTPGTGSSLSHGTETSLGWLPKVGAAIVTINCTQPVAEDDISLILALTPHTPNVTVVLTKADLLSDADLAEVLEHVHERLATTVGAHVPVLLHSTAARHQCHRDGLRHHLRQLDTSHQAAIDGLTVYRARQLAHDCATYLTLSLKAAASTRDAITDLQEALDAEQRRLPSLREQALAQLRPLKSAIEAASKRNLAPAVPTILRRLLSDLPTHLDRNKGSLAAESRHFRDWLKDSLTDEFTPIARHNAQLLAPKVREGLEPVKRMGEAFTNRLSDLLTTATGADLRLPTPELVLSPTPEVEVRIGAIFDSQLEILSWAIPMALFRQAVHHHFQHIVPWEVEKNSYRIAYQAASAASQTLDLTLAAYLDALHEQLDTCRQLISAEAGAQEVMATDLTLLGEAADRLPEPDPVPGHQGDDAEGLLDEVPQSSTPTHDVGARGLLVDRRRPAAGS